MTSNNLKKTTVLHACPVWLPQTQTWMYTQVAELQRLGLDAQVVCEETNNLEQFEVSNIHCLTDKPLWRQLCDRGLRKLRVRRHLDYLVQVGRKTQAEIVHSHFGHIGWANLEAVRQLDAKHVVTFYGMDVNMLPKQFPIWRKRYQQLFSEVDLILCEGSHMARCILAMGCPDYKVKVQHLGVAVTRLVFKPRQWKPGEVLRVLIAASFREKKGTVYAIEALGRLQHEVPLVVTIIGDADVTPESQREKIHILEALERTELINKTNMLGYQAHEALLEEAYRNHVFLHPSVTASNGDTEGGAPVCITEMLATGMLVVSTTHCDIPEVMGIELQHLLTNERNVDGLVACLKTLVQKPNHWRKWAVSGRDRIAQEYDKSMQASRLLCHYEKLTE